MQEPVAEDQLAPADTDDDVAELLREVAAALRMARWSGIDAVARLRPAPAPAAAVQAQPDPPPPTRPPGSSPSLPPPPVSRPPAAAPSPATLPSSAATHLLPAAPPLLRRGGPVVASVGDPSVREATPAASAPPAPLRTAAERLQELQTRAAGCVRCPRHGGRQRVVHGSGDPNARLLVLLEAPSASDETEGQVATGPAGQLLDAMLAAMGLRRDQVWLCLLVQCRDGDRVATSEEATACSGWLRAQWEIVQPAAILAMGTLPAQLLARQASPLAELRGRWLEVRGTPAVATWAPSDLLAADKALKRQAWDDLRLVMARLGLQR